ncbi:hypothetical protein BpHYR1_050158 [Brachionus plicatilis]|uniref:Uncharacterized protein n=1 Tax=Brachionus plicatilis TaxID=10195 RepID=A0A3M7Q5Z8_BRAPC|nr:hypothetical protein BpHYR1_050158 [Brachionus plicatilis]
MAENKIQIQIKEKFWHEFRVWISVKILKNSNFLSRLKKISNKKSLEIRGTNILTNQMKKNFN